MSRAFLSLCTSDQYVIGACTLTLSIREQCHHYPIYCFVDLEKLSDASKLLLMHSFDGLFPIHALTTTHPDLIKKLDSIQRQDLLNTFSKIFLWQLDGSHPTPFIPSPFSTFSSLNHSFYTFSSSNAAENLTWAHEELSINATLYFDAQVKFSRCVYLDADMLVLKNIDYLLDDSLFENAFAACPDIGWPDTFNSGLFVFTPNYPTFNDLLSLINEPEASFDGADQGLLNQYFDEWYKASLTIGPMKNSTKLLRLPFSLNVAFSALYAYEPALLHFKEQLQAIHFLGAQNKPWNASFDGTNWFLSNNVSVDSKAPMLNYFSQWWSLLLNSHLAYFVSRLGGFQLFGCKENKLPHFRDNAAATPNVSLNTSTDTSLRTTTHSLSRRMSREHLGDQDFTSIASYRVSWASNIQKTFEYYRPESTHSLSSSSPISPKSESKTTNKSEESQKVDSVDVKNKNNNINAGMPPPPFWTRNK